jgi:polysaccharide deacetylase family protein (PEP-CTERM system associated)
MIRNFATFDIEEWYHANYDAAGSFEGYADDGRLEGNVARLMEACAAHSVRATCFVLGVVAESKPQVVKSIQAAGHEVACHSHAHRLVTRMSAAEFRADTTRAKHILEDITGEAVVGYRAPSWSVSRAVLPWFYEILTELGFRYSSSVFPVRTFLYGIPDFPTQPHRPIIAGAAVPILEIPAPVVRIFGRAFGYSGGFYLRALPGWFIARVIQHENGAGQPVFIYAHPREIDPNQPRLRLGLRETFIHYHNLSTTETKLHRLLASFAFTPMREYAAGGVGC